ncbi:unnamed protein product [Prorocentrum cordatum]|uniref:Uncharacterized protein n=1 Tax=Prorocentrum cordatum TaxID=2364126 RepID=A0ABN9WT38_9DINO|nr:unnamed protein product [Polarella glacialis]
MMTEYTATKLCVYQTRIYPLIASETDKDVCDVAGCNVNHKDVEVNLDFNGLAAGRGDDCPPSEIDQDAPSEISLLPSTPAVTPRALVQALSPRIPQWWLLEQAQRRRPEAAAAPRLDRYREVFSSFGASLGCDEPEAPPVVEDRSLQGHPPGGHARKKKAQLRRHLLREHAAGVCEAELPQVAAVHRRGVHPAAGAPACGGRLLRDVRGGPAQLGPRRGRRVEDGGAGGGHPGPGRGRGRHGGGAGRVTQETFGGFIGSIIGGVFGIRGDPAQT